MIEVIGKVPKSSGIYTISSPDGTDVYVGASKNLAKRRYGHVNKIRCTGGITHRMRSAFSKHGRFIFRVIELCPQGELDARELFWLAKLNPNLNERMAIGSQSRANKIARLREARKQPRPSAA